MAIPAFGDDGNLPPGRHPASDEEVLAALVDAFPASRTRSGISAYWRSHREALGELVAVQFQWLGGSFTSSKRDPADADIVTVIDGESYDDLPRHRRLLADALLAGHYTESFWNCDVYPLAAYPEGHPGHSKYLIALERLEAYFAHDREGAECGLVEVTP